MDRTIIMLSVATSFFASFPAACLASISGTITDIQSNPINHALVMFSSETDSTVTFKAVTDSLGHYEIGDLPVGVAEESPLPFSLGQNYPNPFNPSTTIPFTLDVSGHVTLTIYNIMGQTVRTLVDSYLPADSHNALWDGRDTAGKGVSAGVYLYRIVAGGHSQSRKMLLLDGGGVSGGGYSQNTQKTAKQATGENALYTITVDRFPYTTHRQEHLTVSASAVLDYTLQDAGLMVAIPGGTFEMGDEVGDLEVGLCRPVHTVTLTGFDMCKYEITNAQYCAYLNAARITGDIDTVNVTYSHFIAVEVYGKTGAWSGQPYLGMGYGNVISQATCWITYASGMFSVTSGYENWPVVFVTWYGAKAFAQFYGLDLPTESEWEYACRGGHQYMYGTDDGSISNTNSNYLISNVDHPFAVGNYPPNPFGLLDMCGNVNEWCDDWYGHYPSDSEVDPTGPQTGSARMYRGGDYSVSATMCRSAYRFFLPPDNFGGGSIGFRIVRRVGGVAN
jgi:formylglycine-generating enzyme required for sulfatase activity